MSRRRRRGAACARAGWLRPPIAALPCFFCGLDSWAFLAFLILVFGVAQLGTLCFLAWSIARGEFRDTERVKHAVLDAEERETAQQGGRGAP